MNKAVVTILILVGVMAILFYVTRDNSATLPPNQAVTNGKSLEPKTSEEEPVKVKVTPTDISPDSFVWKFNIVLDTHSVELDYDLIKVVSLFDNQDKEYKPVSWEGSPPGGHHREGILNFSPIKPFPKSIELRMINVAGASTRSFIWGL